MRTLLDSHFGIAVKDVHTRHIKDKVTFVSYPHRRARVNAGNKLFFAVGEQVQKDFLENTADDETRELLLKITLKQK